LLKIFVFLTISLETGTVTSFFQNGMECVGVKRLLRFSRKRQHEFATIFLLCLGKTLIYYNLLRKSTAPEPLSPVDKRVKLNVAFVSFIIALRRWRALAAMSDNKRNKNYDQLHSCVNRSKRLIRVVS